MPKFGRKVPHLRCDSHTSFSVKRSKVRVGGGRGLTMSAEPGGHTACFNMLFVAEDCHNVSTPLKSSIRVYRRLPADADGSSPATFSRCQHRPTARQINALKGTNGCHSEGVGALTTACDDVKPEKSGRVCPPADAVDVSNKGMVSMGQGNNVLIAYYNSVNVS